MSLEEGERRDVEDDDFYEFCFEKRTGIANISQQALKQHNITAKYFINNLQRASTQQATNSGNHQASAMVHVVCGGPLTGKSMFLRKTCLELLESGKTSLQKSPLVPVYIDFEKLARQKQASRLFDDLIRLADKKGNDFFASLIREAHAD